MYTRRAHFFLIVHFYFATRRLMLQLSYSRERVASTNLEKPSASSLQLLHARSSSSRETGTVKSLENSKALDSMLIEPFRARCSALSFNYVNLNPLSLSLSLPRRKAVSFPIRPRAHLLSLHPSLPSPPPPPPVFSSARASRELPFRLFSPSVFQPGKIDFSAPGNCTQQ